MGAFNLESSRSEVKEIQSKNVERQGQIKNLEQSKQALMDARMEMENDDALDESIKRTIIDALNSGLEENTKKGQEISDEMQTDVERIETITEETDASITDVEQKRASLEQKQSILEKFGLGAAIESGIKEIDNNRNDLEGLRDEATDVAKELDEIAHSAGNV